MAHQPVSSQFPHFNVSNSVESQWVASSQLQTAAEDRAQLNKNKDSFLFLRLFNVL